MKHSLFFITILSVLVSMSMLGHVAFAERLSTEDLLEYSLDSLRSKMDSAVEENQKLSLKNTSIHKRMLLLKKEMRELDDEMIHLREGAIHIKRNIKLDAKELKIEEKHMNNMLQRKRHLEFERDSLKQQIETLALDRQLMQEEVEATNFDIDELQGDVAAPTSSSLLDYYEEEKLKLLDVVQDYRKRIDNKRNKLDYLDLQTADQLRAKEIALRQRASLERSIADLDLRLKEENARESLLNKSTQRLEDGFRDKRGLEERQYADRREYLKELVKTIDDLKVSHEAMEKQFNDDEREMKQYISALGEQNEWLFQYYKSVEAEALLNQKKESDGHTALLLEEQKSDVKQDKDRMQNEANRLQDSIVKQRQVNESLKRDEQRLQNNLKDLEAQVQKTKESVAVFREDAFGKKHKELTKALKEQEQRLEKLNNQLAMSKGSIKEETQTLESSGKHTELLENELNQRVQAVEQMSAKHEELLVQNKELSMLKEKNISAFQKKIEEDLMSKQALEASIDVVHKKYRAGENEAEKFDSEKQELSRYLDVLKQENLSLQNKLRSL